MAESAGILLFRFLDGSPQVMLAHPGGPFWSKRDLGAWSIPKGEFAIGENPEDAARREFAEEIGRLPAGKLLPLGRVVQNRQKFVTGFAMESDFDVTTTSSNHIDIEWPPRSGRTMSVPEIDRAEWFPLEIARDKILVGQLPLLDRLAELLASRD